MVSFRIPQEVDTRMDYISTQRWTDKSSIYRDAVRKYLTENEELFTETELAAKLGISRKSLWERRQRLNIPRKKTQQRGRRESS